MTVYLAKARNRWRYDFELVGERYSGYCVDLDGNPTKNRTEARRCEDRVKAAAQQAAGARPSSSADATLAEAMVVYSDHLATGSHQSNQLTYVRDLLEWFGKATPIVQIEGRVQAYINWSRTQPMKIYVGGPNASRAKGRQVGLWKDSARARSDATINRYLDALRKSLRLFGEQRDPMTGRPMLEWIPKIPELKEPEHTPRPIPDEVISRLITASAEPWPWLSDALVLARNMGFRKTEMMSITLDQVDLENKCVWLQALDTKAKRGESIPANSEAMKVLRRRVAEAQRLGIPWLFWWTRKLKNGSTSKPRPVRNLKRAWKQVQRAIGIRVLYRFHNLKASFVTSLARKRESFSVIQKLARHRDFDTTRRYLQVTDQDLRRAVETIAKGAAARRSPTQESHTAPSEPRKNPAK